MLKIKWGGGGGGEVEIIAQPFYFGKEQTTAQPNWSLEVETAAQNFWSSVLRISNNCPTVVALNLGNLIQMPR